ncbi:MAG: hypothetical protein PHG05_00380 [Candidatus Nanoarchaeia archaeon]|nr:hypothetical protein [Candidatus Nanoarchaeia archaeon]
MKKSFIFFLILILFSSFCFANFEIQGYRDSYCKKDSFVGEIKLDEIPSSILPKNIQLFCLDKKEISPFLVKNNNYSYFFYFDLPDINESCDLKINLQYKEGVERVISFNIDDCYSFSYKPAAFRLNEETYTKIYVKNNYNETYRVNISYPEAIMTSKSYLDIPSGETRTFYVYEKGDNTNEINEILLNDYKLFVLDSIKIVEEEVINETKPVEEGYFGFEAEDKQLTKNLNFGEGYDGVLKVVNDFDFNINEVTFSVEDSLYGVVGLEKDYYDSITKKDSINLYFTIKDDIPEGSYNGKITVTSKEGYSDSFNFFIDVLGNEETVAETPDKTTETDETVEDVTKNIINYGEENKTEKEIELYKQKVDFFGKLWLILVIILVLLFFYWLFNRSKKKKFEDYIKNLKR